MCPFDVLIEAVPDADLGPLLTALDDRGVQPVVTPHRVERSAPSPVERTAVSSDELPASWSGVSKLADQTYLWPDHREAYSAYKVWAADVDGKTIHIALGETTRDAWGRERKYVVAFLTSGSPQVPLVESLAVDDYETSHELIAIIRGKDGGKKMYGPGDLLPDVYRHNFRTELYCDRVDYTRAWNKMGVIIHEDDDTTLLNHALLQARRRGDI